LQIAPSRAYLRDLLIDAFGPRPERDEAHPVHDAAIRKCRRIGRDAPVRAVAGVEEQQELHRHSLKHVENRIYAGIIEARQKSALRVAVLSVRHLLVVAGLDTDVGHGRDVIPQRLAEFSQGREPGFALGMIPGPAGLDVAQRAVRARHQAEFEMRFCGRRRRDVAIKPHHVARLR